LYYERLTDWFLIFDVYDRPAERFWSTNRRDQLCNTLGLNTVPHIGNNKFSLKKIKNEILDQPSSLRNGHMEGIVLRHEDSDWTLERAKIVRPEFCGTIEKHWSKKSLVWNKLAV
jgi:ATP-dependent RNA circularization protein (DNA/RNA ligase family)